MTAAWIVKTSRRRLLGLAASTEMFASWCLWIYGPTDSVRVWYPTVWSYLGEHFVIWLAVILFLGCLLELIGLGVLPDSSGIEGLYTLPRYLGFAAVVIISDVAASLFLGAWSGQYFRMWYTHRLEDYLCLREPILVIAFTVGGLFVNRFSRVLAKE